MQTTSLFCPCFFGESDHIGFTVRFSFRAELGSIVHQILNGRAHGPGVLLLGNGTVLEGSWVENKRVGAFQSIDAKGQIWKERYNEAGAKVARKKAPPAGEEGADDAPQLTSAARKCTRCSLLFHTAFNHLYACRKHVANFIPNRNDDDGPSGIWSCCGSQDEQDPGCDFSMHCEPVAVRNRE